MSERISDERLAELSTVIDGSSGKLGMWLTSFGLADLSECLLELQARRRESEWRPIETAPDDTPVIGWNVDYGARETAHRLYAEGSIAHANDPLARYWSWSEPRNNWGSSWQPTHWLPLPEPPHAG